MPLLFVKFLNKAILGESGRLVFTLLNSFSRSGYQIHLYDNINLDKFNRTGALIRTIDNLCFKRTISDFDKNYIYLFDKKEKNTKNHTWGKQIQIKFNIFSSYWLRRKPLVMPFPLHPVHWGHHGKNMANTLAMLRNSQKKIKLFFSGDIKGYRRPKISYPECKLSRPEIIESIIQSLPNDSLQIDDHAILDSVYSNGYLNKFVVLDTSKVWVDDSIWFDRLSAADFFLAPPGICMPMCHNVIEAMALGVIPVLNYPEWFSPSLEHMHNCIVFGNHDLIQNVKKVLAMEQYEIAELRANVIEYYHNYLRPEIFVNNVESRPEHKVTVLMMTEKYVSENSNKLNRNSILMRNSHLKK